MQFESYPGSQIYLRTSASKQVLTSSNLGMLLVVSLNIGSKNASFFDYAEFLQPIEGDLISINNRVLVLIDIMAEGITS